MPASVRPQLGASLIPTLTRCTRRSTIGAEVRERLLRGESNALICAALKASPATVSHHARTLGLGKASRPTYDWSAVQADIDRGLRLRELVEKYRFARATYSKAVASGRVVPRKTQAQMSLDELLTFVANRRTSSGERRHLKRLLIKEGTPRECRECKNARWLGRPISLDLDHIDGNPRHNFRENYRLLCPNCHSMTSTWRGRNCRK